MRIRANFHEADWAEEQIGGVSYLWFLRKLAAGFEASWPTLSAAMERIRSLLVTRAGMLCNVTIDAANWRRFKPELTSFLAALPSSPVAQSSWQIGEGPSSEALIIPASVNYVGKGANLYRLGLTQRCGPRRRQISPNDLAMGYGPRSGRRVWRLLRA